MGLLVKTPSPLKQKQKSKRFRATTFGTRHKNNEIGIKNENEAENYRHLHLQSNGMPVSSLIASIPTLICEVKHDQHNGSETVESIPGGGYERRNLISKQDIFPEDRNDEDALHQRRIRFLESKTGLGIELKEKDSGQRGSSSSSDDRGHPLADSKSMTLYEAFECIVPHTECESDGENGEEYFSCDEKVEKDDCRHEKEGNGKRTSSLARVLSNFGSSRWKYSSSGNNSSRSNRSNRSARSMRSIRSSISNRSIRSNSDKDLIQPEQEAKEIHDTLSTVTTEKSEGCFAKREEEEEQTPQNELREKAIEIEEPVAAVPDSGPVSSARVPGLGPVAAVPELEPCVIPGLLPDMKSSANANTNEFQEDILDPIFESSSYESANESESTDFDNVFYSVGLASFETNSAEQEEIAAPFETIMEDMVIRNDELFQSSSDEADSNGDEAIQDSSDEAGEENSIDDSERNDVKDDASNDSREAVESVECDNSRLECFERSESEHRAFHECRAAAPKKRPPEPLWVRNDDKRNELAWVRCAARNRDRPMDFPISKRRLDVKEQEEESMNSSSSTWWSSWFSCFSVCGEVFIL